MNDRCHPRTESLASSASPEQVLTVLAGREGLFCLNGGWAGGGALIGWDPQRRAHGWSDAVAALSESPATLPVDDNVVGGGWFGLFGYDEAVNHLAFHDFLLRWDAGAGWRFESLQTPQRAARLDEIRGECERILAAAESARDVGRSLGIGFELGPGQSMAGYLAAAERAVGLIRSGEIYQVNLCTRLRAATAGRPDAVAAFNRAVGELRPAFGALLTGIPARADGWVLSLSPELFLRRRGREVQTQPIKGTLPRTPGTDPDRDPAATRLRVSAKDVAENIMIVDLMRNDLARVCEAGSVRTPDLLRVEPHAGVWHLISTVAGRLRPEIDDADLVRACFPPGSVTGTPKIRAQAAIDALEPAPRGGYTGALGFLSPCWGLELSVVIRAFEGGSSHVELGVGGGVTAESVPMLEWRECLAKAAPVIAAIGATGPAAPGQADGRRGGLLETMLALDGAVLRLADHLARLDRSCRELYSLGLPPDTAARIGDLLTANPRPDRRRLAIRVIARHQAGKLSVDLSWAPSAAPPESTAARVASRPPGLWRHKWADRSALVAIEGTSAAVPLFLSADGSVLETSRGNVFVLDADDVLWTHPLTDALLPGVTRRAVLDAADDLGWRTRIEPFPPGKLMASAAFWTSSLSGVVGIDTLDGQPLRSAGRWLGNLRRALGV